MLVKQGQAHTYARTRPTTPPGSHTGMYTKNTHQTEWTDWCPWKPCVNNLHSDSQETVAHNSSVYLHQVVITGANSTTQTTVHQIYHKLVGLQFHFHPHVTFANHSHGWVLSCGQSTRHVRLGRQTHHHREWLSVVLRLTETHASTLRVHEPNHCILCSVNPHATLRSTAKDCSVSCHINQSGIQSLRKSKNHRAVGIKILHQQHMGGVQCECSSPSLLKNSGENQSYCEQDAQARGTAGDPELEQSSKSSKSIIKTPDHISQTHHFTVRKLYVHNHCQSERTELELILQ